MGAGRTREEAWRVGKPMNLEAITIDKQHGMVFLVHMKWGQDLMELIIWTVLEHPLQQLILAAQKRAPATWRSCPA
jgi:hypothetical protein